MHFLNHIFRRSFPVLAVIFLYGCAFGDARREDSPKKIPEDQGIEVLKLSKGQKRLISGRDTTRYVGENSTVEDPDYQEYLEWKKWQEFQQYKSWKKEQDRLESGTTE